MAYRYIQRNNKLKLVNSNFFTHDLDLNPMTLILKLDLDMVKMYLHARSSYVKQIKSYSLNRQTHRRTDGQMNRQTDRQTDRHDQKHYLPAFAGGNYDRCIKFVSRVGLRKYLDYYQVFGINKNSVINFICL